MRTAMRAGRLTIDESEIIENFVRASGPGGQNVNKVASAVELRFDARRSKGLPDDVSARLQRLAGSRLTQDGIIVIFAQRFRSQERNRADARERLVALLIEAQERPTIRRATRPTLASKEKRLESKGRRSLVKSFRNRKPDVD
jgi:ribosome-associated protein